MKIGRDSFLRSRSSRGQKAQASKAFGIGESRANGLRRHVRNETRASCERTNEGYEERIL